MFTAIEFHEQKHREFRAELNECRRETDRLHEELASYSSAKKFFAEEKMSFEAQFRRSVDETLSNHTRVFADRMIQAPWMGQISTVSGRERSILFIPTDGSSDRLTVETRGESFGLLFLFVLVPSCFVCGFLFYNFFILIKAIFVDGFQVMPRLSRSMGLYRSSSLHEPGFSTSCSGSPAAFRLARRLRRHSLGFVLVRSSFRRITFRRPNPSERCLFLLRCPWDRLRRRCYPSHRLRSLRRHPSLVTTPIPTRWPLLVVVRGPRLPVSRWVRGPVMRRVVGVTERLTSLLTVPGPCRLMTAVDRHP